MTLDNIAVGDTVCVRTRRWHPMPQYTLCRVARINGYAFVLEDGRSFSKRTGRMTNHDTPHNADVVEATEAIMAQIQGGR